MQSFILDRHTDPSNPTMKVTQDDKIPVYDSAADAEADFANIAEDQIYFTKEDKFDVDDMKQYIRNQNVLSDWEKITISIDSSNPTEIQYDGFITVHNTVGTGPFRFYVNGVEVTNEGASSNAPRGHTLPLKKGDSVYTTGVAQDSTTYFLVSFYKLRDYSDR